MPNHIHLLLTLSGNNGRGDPSPTVADVLGWFKYNATKQINLISNTMGNRVFQRSFYDRVVRDMDEYLAFKKYISDNPKRWFFDELYCED
jgi:REP element-mobilizing transposase RayT